MLTGSREGDVERKWEIKILMGDEYAFKIPGRQNQLVFSFVGPTESDDVDSLNGE